MAGFHLSCGEWMGTDKSASAISEVLTDVSKVVTPKERAAWRDDFMRPFNAQITSDDPGDFPPIRMSKEMMEALIGPLRRYRKKLGERLGDPDPYEAPQLVEDSGNRDSDGWRLLCAQELIAAYEACMESGEPVVLIFC